MGGGAAAGGDVRAGVAAKLLQLTSGLVHAPTGSTVLPQPLAWAAGALFLAAVLVHAFRRRARADKTAVIPLMFLTAALLPLLAADWIVGARYFYLPTVGLAWLAGRWFSSRSPPALVMMFSALLGLGLAQAILRQHDVARYNTRLAAVSAAVSDGVKQGHAVFHVTSGIKDVDLALKGTPELAAARSRLLVLSDVPASFVIMPPALQPAAGFLLAVPPIPPSGAYQFGDRRIVGLPRRGDDPPLADVIKRLPGIRFIRLHTEPGPGGRTAARDVTEEVRRANE